MYPFLMFVAGLVLWLAGPHWFAGAKTVGIILTLAGGVWLLVFLLLLVVALLAISDQ